MNELFGVDPSAFEDAKDVQLVFSQFGFEHGRFLAQFPKGWQRQFREKISCFPDWQRKKAESVFLKSRESALIRTGWPFRSELSWPANASMCVQESKLKQAFGARASDSFLPAIDDLDEYLDDCSYVDVKGTPALLASAACILIQESEELWFIDPFFDFSKDSKKDVLQAFLQIAAKVGKPRRFVICARDSKCDKDRLGAAFASVKEKLSPMLGLTFYLFDDDVSKDCRTHRMHERYLISMKGGLEYGKGFSAVSHNVPIKVLGKKQHHELCRLFIGEEHGFQLIAKYS
jgi:hypothetical protein